MLGRKQMETPPTSTKESVLLQHQTHSFPSGPSSQSHIEYSWVVFFYHVRWQHLKQEENMHAI